MADTYTLDKLPGEPIVLSVVKEGWQLSDLPDVIDGYLKMLEATDVPLFFISDMTDLHISLDGVIQAVDLASRGAAPVLHHPMSKALLVVTQSRMLELSTLGLRSKVFGGGVRAYVFKAQGEALAFAREYSDKSLPEG
jgi:hypothetical protein